MNYANLEGSIWKKIISLTEKEKKVPMEMKEMETELLTKKDMAEFTKRNTPMSEYLE